MKRLFLTLGLVIAFFFTAQSSAATIYDSVTSFHPEIESTTSYDCVYKNSSKVDVSTKTSSIDACMALVVENLYKPPVKPDPLSKGDKWHTIDNVFKRSTCTLTSCEIMIQTTSYEYIQIGTSGSNFKIIDYSPYYQVFGKASNPKQTQNVSCPPLLYPNYNFELDLNLDGEPEKCLNPEELDNASNCANDVGNMLPALTNLATKVCKTNQDSGARCGYSKKDGDVVYKLDLEMNCFGDSENKVPEYNPEPMPEPSNCAKYNDGLMVCKEKPENKCDANGNCQDQCGFFNKEFYCFINCSGEECDKETPPPVNCETNPTAPVCVEEPDPELDPDFCKNNPTDPKCVTPPEPCTGDNCPPDGGGGGGGTGEKVDLKPVVDELKELNKKLDFKTTDKTGKANFGGFSDLFSNSDIQAIKNMTDDKKQEITEQITTIKAEFKDMFEVTAAGGAYTDITLNLSMGDFHPQFWTFIQANIGIIGAIVMALAYLMAIRVISE